MLGKILKYEFKATARLFVVLYAALIVIAAYNAFFQPFDNDYLHFNEGTLGQTVFTTVASLSMILYVLMVVAGLIMTFVIIVLRFYRMFGDEGYLWFSLPATANQHLLGRLIVAFVWSVASIVVMVISVGLLTIRSGWYKEVHRLPELWNLLEGLGFNPGLWLTLGIILLIASWLSSIMTFYASVAMGPSVIKSRLGGTVLVYLIITVASQILATVGIVALAAPLNSQVDILNNLDSYTFSSTSSIAATQAVDTMAIMGIVTFIVISLVTAAVLYILSRYFMTKKLNLG